MLDYATAPHRHAKKRDRPRGWNLIDSSINCNVQHDTTLKDSLRKHVAVLYFLSAHVSPDLIFIDDPPRTRRGNQT